MLYKDNPEWALGKQPFMVVYDTAEKVRELAAHLGRALRSGVYGPLTEVRAEPVPCFTSVESVYEAERDIKLRKLAEQVGLEAARSLCR